MLGFLGCAGPGPKLFPSAPVQRYSTAEGSAELWFDTNRDGRGDYVEYYAGKDRPDSEPGETPAPRVERLVAIGYDCDQDGRVEDTIVLDQVPAEERRYLALLLDSVPFEVVREMWLEGWLRYCARPARVISPFPVMTDLSFAEFFHVSPIPAVESEYYDGKQLKGGYGVYMREENAPWTACTDYHMPQINHGNAYLNVRPWFAHELGRIQKMFLQCDRPLLVGYCVGTSAMGAIYGRQGHVDAIVMVDRMCRELIYRTRGRARFAMLSDHGHHFACCESERVPLRRELNQRCYRVRDRLTRPKDVVVPEFAMVSCASIYSRAPAKVAADVVRIEGVDLAAYRQGDQVVVVGRDGQARISRSGRGYRYQLESGDPLELRPVLENLERAGQVGPDGFVSDRVLFEATVDHVYPDAVARLWRAFDGLVVHTPDVLVSFLDGYHAGSKLQTELITLIGVHGSLRPMSTYGFAMTSDGELPADIRMGDLREAMRAAGVPFGEAR